LKPPTKHPISLEANSPFRDIILIFFKTPDGIYATFITLIFFSLGSLAILMPDLAIQHFAEILKLFYTPPVMMGYVIWHRLGNPMTASFNIAMSVLGTSILAVVPFYKFLLNKS
jgi:hypothetical protein